MSGADSLPAPVGILGGSFDPVHFGHLRIASEARRRLGLTRVLLMPAASPPHKPADELSPAHHREAMLRLAVRRRMGLELATLELRTGRVCYTIDTLRRLRDGIPPCTPLFILGMDSLRQITTWRAWRELLREFDCAVVDRLGPDASTDSMLHGEVRARLVPLSNGALQDADRAALRVGRGGRIFQLPLAPIPIAARAIRARVREGAGIGDLVPPAVARYIQRTGLYRQEKGH